MTVETSRLHVLTVGHERYGDFIANYPKQPHRTALCRFAKSLRDGVLDASGGVCSKVSNRPLREAPDGVHQTDIALLN
jgi:hypothetical protein